MSEDILVKWASVFEHARDLVAKNNPVAWWVGAQEIVALADEVLNERQNIARQRIAELEGERDEAKPVLEAANAACEDWFAAGQWSLELLLALGTAWRAARAVEEEGA